VRTSLIRLVATASLLSVASGLNAQTPQSSNAPSVDHPCSFITAGEMAGLLATPVASAADERFRCKYAVGKGWIETKDAAECTKAGGKVSAK